MSGDEINEREGNGRVVDADEVRSAVGDGEGGMVLSLPLSASCTAGLVIVKA
jgi:hypothetical protein